MPRIGASHKLQRNGVYPVVKANVTVVLYVSYNEGVPVLANVRSLVEQKGNITCLLRDRVVVVLDLIFSN